ncbi:hypothetical protein BS17DRAFT_786928 [Gyrodon lividus]|nr:hypothetical protein BS17DRAFT_786928 [Gyrodon lividus]
MSCSITPQPQPLTRPPALDSPQLGTSFPSTAPCPFTTRHQSPEITNLSKVERLRY